jgi:3'-phosphoadenosine 5'-phosphosulfate sulfotransferase (PAPS reductase)/FAD synthetase
MEKWQLQQMQQLPLETKIEKTKLRIQEWYEKFDGEVYISFSGGKDSTVLLDIARQLYPDIKAVFCDTGLEYPEIRYFVKTVENVEWIKPQMHFTDVIKQYGFPLISKEQAQYIQQFRNAKSEKTKDTRWNGNKYGQGKISEKWKFLVNAPFKISERCCDVMKKNPFKRYEKQSKNHPIIGIMAEESSKRVQDYLRFGCNAFDAKRPVSRPLGFWINNDILEYLYKFKTPYASIYGEIIEDDNKNYINTGVERTGCMWCLFGIQYDDSPNRIQNMKLTHPKIYDYCINKLGIGEVLDYINVKYN